MDSIMIMLSRHRPDFLDILKESLVFPFSSIRFIIFTSLSSFPFTTFLFFFNLTLQHFIEPMFHHPDQLPGMTHSPLHRTLPPPPVHQHRHLLQLISIATSVDLATRLYGREELGISSLSESLRKLIIKGPLIMFTYHVLLSTSTLIGLLWIITNCFFFIGSFFSHDNCYYHEHYYNWYGLSIMVRLVVTMALGAGFIALLVKYMEWSGGWNMSVVVTNLNRV